MKPTNLLWGTMSLNVVSLSILVFSYPSVTQAQCVIADVAIQASVSGSKRPATQRNEVEIDSQGSCVGNTSVNVGRQVNVGGTGEVIQERKSRHEIRGDNNRSDTNRGGETIAIPVGVQVDVYNPADRLSSGRRR